DEAGQNNMAPATGTIIPGKKNDNGEYVISVTYKDKERMGIESNVVKKHFILKHPRLKAVASDDDYGVAKVSPSLVRFTTSGSWIMFKSIDLTNISSLLYSLDPTQIGGKLSLRLDNPGGKEVASLSINQKDRPQKAGPDQEHKWERLASPLTPVSGLHDLYIVYTDPENAKSNIYVTLFLDWIEFKK
ncbi:MAG TPA: carbohydrate-binding protein, partial [Chitinophagaceae bacterium]|nr:carbohydrate-binding protein [Chitinophagaceae bacterium]